MICRLRKIPMTCGFAPIHADDRRARRRVMAILRRAVRILGPGRPRALGPLAFAAAAGFATLAQAYDSIEVVGYDVSAYNNGQTINWWGAS